MADDTSSSMTEKGSVRQSSRLNSSTESPQGKGSAGETGTGTGTGGDGEKKLIRTRSVTQAIQSAAEKKAEEERQRLRVEKRTRRQTRLAEAKEAPVGVEPSDLKKRVLTRKRSTTKEVAEYLEQVRSKRNSTGSTKAQPGRKPKSTGDEGASNTADEQQTGDKEDTESQDSEVRQSPSENSLMDTSTVSENPMSESTEAHTKPATGSSKSAIESSRHVVPVATTAAAASSSGQSASSSAEPKKLLAQHPHSNNHSSTPQPEQRISLSGFIASPSFKATPLTAKFDDVLHSHSQPSSGHHPSSSNQSALSTPMSTRQSQRLTLRSSRDHSKIGQDTRQMTSAANANDNVVTSESIGTHNDAFFSQSEHKIELEIDPLTLSEGLFGLSAEGNPQKDDDNKWESNSSQLLHSPTSRPVNSSHDLRIQKSPQAIDILTNSTSGDGDQPKTRKYRKIMKEEKVAQSPRRRGRLPLSSNPTDFLNEYSEGSAASIHQKEGADPSTINFSLQSPDSYTMGLQKNTNYVSYQHWGSTVKASPHASVSFQIHPPTNHSEFPSGMAFDSTSVEHVTTPSLSIPSRIPFGLPSLIAKRDYLNGFNGADANRLIGMYWAPAKLLSIPRTPKRAFGMSNSNPSTPSNLGRPRLYIRKDKLASMGVAPLPLTPMSTAPTGVLAFTPTESLGSFPNTPMEVAPADSDSDQDSLFSLLPTPKPAEKPEVPFWKEMEPFFRYLEGSDLAILKDETATRIEEGMLSVPALGNLEEELKAQGLTRQDLRPPMHEDDDTESIPETKLDIPTPPENEFDPLWLIQTLLSSFPPKEPANDQEPCQSPDDDTHIVPKESSNPANQNVDVAKPDPTEEEVTEDEVLGELQLKQQRLSVVVESNLKMRQELMDKLAPYVEKHKYERHLWEAYDRVERDYVQTLEIIQRNPPRMYRKKRRGRREGSSSQRDYDVASAEAMMGIRSHDNTHEYANGS